MNSEKTQIEEVDELNHFSELSISSFAFWSDSSDDVYQNYCPRKAVFKAIPLSNKRRLRR